MVIGGARSFTALFVFGAGGVGGMFAGSKSCCFGFNVIINNFCWALVKPSGGGDDGSDDGTATTW